MPVQEYYTCSLSGDWTILDDSLEFSWAFFTNSKSALEIWKQKIHNRLISDFTVLDVPCYIKQEYISKL